VTPAGAAVEVIRVHLSREFHDLLSKTRKFGIAGRQGFCGRVLRLFADSRRWLLNVALSTA
jgi:hypothetical protein